MPTFVEDYGDRRGYGNRLRGRVRNFYEQVQIFNKAAFGRINRLAGEDIDGAVLVERKAKAADPRKTIVPVIARHRCIGSRSEEHTSELQSLMRNSYAVLCLKKKT